MKDMTEINKKLEKLDDTDYRVEELIACIKVLRQTIMEVNHAQMSGPDWYTKNEKGLFQQVRLHIDRARVALEKVKDILDQE